MFLAATVLGSGPAAAQSIIETQSLPFGDSQTTTNSSKRTTTLQTIIVNPLLAPANANAGANPSPAEPVQLIDFTQTIDLDSAILVINSGFIDPVVGIETQIINVVGSFANVAAMANANDAPVPVPLLQALKLLQSNRIASDITKNNTGNIIAVLVDMSAVIDNRPIGSLSNVVAASNANGEAAEFQLDDVAQTAEFLQANAIDSGISITNRASLAASIGISAEINTEFDGSLSNDAAISNANGGAALITLVDLDQTVDLDQSNAVTSSINVENDGSFVGDETAVSAEINNRLIGALSNIAALSNTNGQAAGIGLSALSQEVDLGQINEIRGAIVIDNSAVIESGDAGLWAAIYNVAINQIVNDFAASNVNGAVDLIALADLAQSFDLDQTNIINNSIDIRNRGQTGSYRGIDARIETQAIGSLTNQLVASNANGTAGLITGDDVTQTFDVHQDNKIASSILVDSESDVDADDMGLRGQIETSAIEELRNIFRVTNANGEAGLLTIGSVDQSVLSRQANTISSNVVLNGAAGIGADTGIWAQITTEDLSLINEAEATNLNGTASLDDDEDLTQSADIVQNNRVENTISASNAGNLNAAGTGIRALIDNDDLELLNEAQFGFVNDGADVGGDVTQTAKLEQRNSVTSKITVWNSGELTAADIGVSAEIENSALVLSNQIGGSATGDSDIAGEMARTIAVTQSNKVESKITVNNSGSIWGGNLGIYAEISQPPPSATNQYEGPTASVDQEGIDEKSILVRNAGAITAGNLFAINTEGASTTIANRAAGLITGYVDLTDLADLFDNQAGGTFAARLTSDFGDGDDLFDNNGTVHALAVGADQPFFVNLERFDNSGVISTVNGSVGDVFTMSGPGFEFDANNGSTVAVDAFLGGPGSTADNLVINGNVTGQTVLTVNNTNPGGGALNKAGIPVVFVNGNVESNSFYLPKPIDAGAFDYDLFFVPTGSGYFELRSFPGGGSHHLPELVTSLQDVFFTGTETWLDRTADLRVLLNGGVPFGSGGQSADGARPVSTSFTPAMWFKGSGTWLNQQDTARTSAFGRTYNYDLSRNLDVWNLEGGIDFGKKGVLAAGDALVFGVLGGAVLGNLNYDELVRQFDLSGGEAGAYATYLRGGLFVDTLFKTTFLEFDPNGSSGFSGSFNGMAWGARTDTGYRFGGFKGGPFIEPQATIAVAWSELDNLTIGGDRVTFNEGTNVRGRVGVRVGTSYDIWPEIRMEPFVIGSLWGTLSGENTATLTSLGTTFANFSDEPDDVWGVVSTGVNFFSPGTQTSLFAKLDVTFGEETDGIAARGGARVSW